MLLRPLPQDFGAYRIEQYLNQGGMGTVYLATDPGGRQVALKIPKFRRDEESVAAERFLREARIAGDIDHPNFCPVLDSGEVDGLLFLAMPYLPGEPLSGRTGRPWPARRAAALVRRLALVLGVLHARGLIHRDLKPGNIMLTDEDTPVLLDFGLACSYTQMSQRLTRTGEVLGTVEYMAPEQVQGSIREQGPPTDVWSLGVIFYELLTGTLPFRAGNVWGVIPLILSAEPDPPSARHRGLGGEEDRLCLRALAKSPGERYPTMEEFARALQAYLGEDETGPAEPPPAPRPAEVPPSGQLTRTLTAVAEAAEPDTRPLTQVTESSAGPAETWDEQRALEALAGLEAVVRRDESLEGRPVVEVLLSNSSATDADLPLLAGFTRLQTLKLSCTRVTDVGLAHLAGLSQLHTLDLTNTAVTDGGLAHLAGLTRLHVLNLSGVPVTDAGLAHLAGLTWLRTLNLLATRVTDPGLSHLAGLGRLEALNLSGVKVTDAGLAHLAGLSQLHTLDLTNTKVTDPGLAHLAGLGQLHTLSLSGTEVGDGGLAHLAGLGRLQVLNLWNTRVTDAGLPHLARLDLLQTLNLRFTKVTGAGLVHLAGLTGLRTLDLTNTKADDAGLAHLAGLGRLEELSLRFTEVTDAGLPYLAGLSQLRSLDLASTKVTDEGLAYLVGLAHLHTLNLRFTKVTDAGLAHLARLARLHVLNLWNTEVTDAGLAHLAGLGQLRQLDLSGTGVTDAGLAHLGGLGQLQKLDLALTGVTDAGAAGLENQLPDCRINL